MQRNKPIGVLTLFIVLVYPIDVHTRTRGVRARYRNRNPYVISRAAYAAPRTHSVFSLCIYVLHARSKC